MKRFLFWALCMPSMILVAQNRDISISIVPTMISYQGKNVKAKKLTVSSEIPFSADSIWEKMQLPETLMYVASGMVRFVPVGEEFPVKWVEGETYQAKMRIWGFLPFGGVHHLHVQQINDSIQQVVSHEHNKRIRVWNHSIEIKELPNGYTHYTDEIVIYAGLLTGVTTLFARKFYKHRQKRWRKLDAAM